MRTLTALTHTAVMALSVTASADGSVIRNPVLPSMLIRESALGTCIENQLKAQSPAPQGSLLVFAGPFQKYSDPEMTKPVVGVAEVYYVTEVSSRSRTSYSIELVTPDAAGWQLAQDASEIRMYATLMGSKASVLERKTGVFQFEVDLTTCADLFKW